MIRVPPGTVVTQMTAGGGGWGDPARRDPDSVAADVRAGIVSREVARDVYRVAFGDDGALDADATRRLRQTPTQTSEVS
jgi:N-methylhydantoinase B